MDFKQISEEYRGIINNYLHRFLSSRSGDIYEAAAYSLYAGGKRIRPVLSLAVADAFSGSRREALIFGSAIEMIHTYSLIHDDLPCMDNDDLRRGKPTNHKVFGEATATLAGDALLNIACESVLEANLPPKKTVDALRIIYSSSGGDGMIGGQILDMKAEKTPLDENGLIMLHRKKTGALIDASVSVGALAADCDKDILKEYSSSLGLAFQIRDDILDIEGNEEEFGKPINSDIKNNKTTFVSLYGIDGAKERLIEETEKAIKSIEFLGEKGDFLREFAYYLLNRNN